MTDRPPLFGDEPEFVKAVYEQQLNQRWRGSRTQDWTVLGVVMTLLVGIMALELKLSELEDWYVFIVPAILAVLPAWAANLGEQVLWKHRIAMMHADHVAKGIEAMHGLRQFRTSPDGDLQPTHASNGDPRLYVGFAEIEGRREFVYPSKETFEAAKPLTFEKFKKDIDEGGNVQALIGRVYDCVRWASFMLIVLAALLAGRACGWTAA